MTKPTRFWATLERFAVPELVRADWRLALGDEFDQADPFLRVTGTQAEEFPCTHQPACGCRHEIVAHEPTRIVAACRCEPRECRSIRLEPKEVLIHALDGRRLCGAIARALKFETATEQPGSAASKIWLVGTYRRTHSPVYLALCPSAELLHCNLERLICGQAEPFLLLAPTARNRSASVQSLLQRHRCEFISLADCLGWSGRGSFAETNSIQPVLDRFAARLAEGSGLVRTVERIDRNIEAVAKGNFELRTAKQRLEQMQGENLFKFVQKIDADAFRIICAVLAHGTVAKASRALGKKDQTLRDAIKGWEKRGGPYRGLAELVRWRKGKRLTGTVPFNDALLYDNKAEASRESVFAELLDGLMSMTESNWQDVADEMADLLKSQMAR